MAETVTLTLSSPGSKYVRQYTAEQLFAAARRGELRFRFKDVSVATLEIVSDEPARPEDYQVRL